MLNQPILFCCFRCAQVLGESDGHHCCMRSTRCILCASRVRAPQRSTQPISRNYVTDSIEYMNSKAIFDLFVARFWENPMGIIVVCVVLGAYFVLLVYARRNDRLNRIKVILHALHITFVSFSLHSLN